MPQVLLDFEPDAEGKLMQGAEYDWGNAQYGAKFGDENMELTFINWDKATNAPATVTEKGPFQLRRHLHCRQYRRDLLSRLLCARQRRLQPVHLARLAI